ncbi:unnamed protein product [Linum trigynum]|uniref:Uncharacterized protein n=1 Tax=Linum trigynum TaxID=586398 RepID=A0AAV2GQT6_9ROSI
MAAAASASGNGSGNKNFHLKVVAIVTTAAVTKEEERVFTLPLEPMLNEDTALPHMRKIVESFAPMKIPDPEDKVAIVDKVVDCALRLFVALERVHQTNDDDDNKKTTSGGLDAERKWWFYSKDDGLPQTTVTIYVAHDGFVSAVGDFELDDTDDSDDEEDDDEEEEEEEGGVDSMEKK